MIGKDDVKRVAHLARLQLADEEVERITKDLERIVGYVDELFAMDVSGTEPMTHAVPLDCPLRADTAQDGIGRAALAQSAGFEDGLVRVPKVV